MAISSSAPSAARKSTQGRRLIRDRILRLGKDSRKSCASILWECTLLVRKGDRLVARL